MSLKEIQKQDGDEDTKRLPCYRKMQVKKDWKTTLLLLHAYATDIE